MAQKRARTLCFRTKERARFEERSARLSTDLTDDRRTIATDGRVGQKVAGLLSKRGSKDGILAY